MPLFSFVCQKCGETSEILVRSNDKPVCPQCGSSRMEKQLSAFAPVAGGSGGHDLPPSCQSCCSRKQGTCPNL